MGRGPGAGLPGRVSSHKSGGRDVWSPPLAGEPDDPEAAVWDCLREVLDPEIPVSVVDLGLIYGVEVAGRRVRVRLTFTATACPCMAFIEEDVRDRLTREAFVDEVDLEVTWDPPWTTERVSEEGRRALRAMGMGA